MPKSLTPQQIGLLIGSLAVVAALAAGVYLEFFFIPSPTAVATETQYPTARVVHDLGPHGVYINIRDLVPVQGTGDLQATVPESALGKDDIGH
jgi:hypothetical protein